MPSAPPGHTTAVITPELRDANGGKLGLKFAESKSAGGGRYISAPPAGASLGLGLAEGQKLVSINGVSVEAADKVQFRNMCTAEGALTILTVQDEAGYAALLDAKKASGKGVVVSGTASVPAPSPAEAASGDEYDGMGRLQLVKLCKERGLAYQAVAKDPAGLKALLRA